MIWANFLHIYQPSNQKPKILEKVVHESYRKIIQELQRTPDAKLTLNINAGLTELLAKHGFNDVIENLRSLAKAGQLEFTGSAKYHAFLPKLPKEEIIRQIHLNQQTNQKYFGDAYQPMGFFPPEMAFTKDIAKIIRDLGYKWMLADEASYPGENPDYSKIYTIEGLGDFTVFFRERETSFKILSAQLGSGPMLLANLGPRLQKNEYLLTAMDGETFGHHRPGLEKLLFDIYQSKELPTATISELLGKHSFEKTACDPIPASWALMHKDIARNLPFSRWYNPKNAIHRMQWQLTALAIGEAKKAKEKGKPYQKARALLDKALHSDQYWWASAKPWWSLEILEKGAKELLEVVLILEGKNIQSAKKAQELYKNIVFTALDWQRNGIVEDLVKEHYDEEVSMRLDTSAPYVPPEEFDKIIEHLRKQMLECAQSEEYEKAAQFRDRITELKGKRKEATSKV